MDFYTIVILLAIVILILLLTYIGIAMSKVQMEQPFPPHQNTCPDYWVEVEAGKCQFPVAGNRNTGDFKSISHTEGSGEEQVRGTKYISSANIGSLYVPAGGKAGLIPNTTQFKEVIDVNASGWTSEYQGVSLTCAKKKWADKHGIAWDGITNSNACV